MTDPLTALRDSLDAQAREAEAAFAPHANGHSLIRGAFQTITATNRELRALANTAALKLHELEENDLMPEAGKVRLMTETREGARAQYEQLRQKLDGALAVLETATRDAALPRVPRDREALVRDEAVMRMSGTTDPVKALEELAALGGDLGALAASGWGESYLRAKGLSPAEAKRMHREVVQVVAIDAAAKSADTTVAANAKAYFALPHVKKAALIHLNRAGDDLKAAGVDWK